MDGSESPADIPQPAHIVLRPQYREALAVFDAAVCEALAVGQEIGVRLAEPHIGYATHVFARICSHANAMITAAPLSRWVRRDHQNWDFSAVCGHARSVIEGYLLFRYLIDAPANEEGAVHAMVKVMHLYDCTTRIKVLRHHATAEEIEGFERQAVEIRERLLSNEWFTTLGSKLQKELLSGKHLMVKTRDQQLDALGWVKSDFYHLWHVLSQYTHVLSFSFYRMEPNGRGTGLENDFDRSYISMALVQCAAVLVEATDRLVEVFPETGEVRQGSDSKFSPGPARNLPRWKKRRRTT